MQQGNSTICREFAMAVNKQSAMIRSLQDTVVQRNGVIHHYQAGMKSSQRASGRNPGLTDQLKYCQLPDTWSYGNGPKRDLASTLFCSSVQAVSLDSKKRSLCCREKLSESKGSVSHLELGGDTVREIAARVALSHTESGNVTPSTSSPPTAAFGEPPKKKREVEQIEFGRCPNPSSFKIGRTCFICEASESSQLFENSFMDGLGEIEASRMFRRIYPDFEVFDSKIASGQRNFFRKFEKNKSILKKKNRRRKQDS